MSIQPITIQAQPQLSVVSLGFQDVHLIVSLKIKRFIALDVLVNQIMNRFDASWKQPHLMKDKDMEYKNKK